MKILFVLLFCQILAFIQNFKLCQICDEKNIKPQMKCENVIVNGCSQCVCKCKRGLVKIGKYYNSEYFFTINVVYNFFTINF